MLIRSGEGDITRAGKKDDVGNGWGGVGGGGYGEGGAGNDDDAGIGDINDEGRDGGGSDESGVDTIYTTSSTVWMLVSWWWLKC